MGVVRHILLGVAAGVGNALASWQREESERQKREQDEERFGTCSWCGELLLQPIHDSDCPARFGDRELMRARDK